MQFPFQSDCIGKIFFCQAEHIHYERAATTTSTARASQPQGEQELQAAPAANAIERLENN